MNINSYVTTTRQTEHQEEVVDVLNKEIVQTAPLLKLPTEILLVIFQFLTPQEARKSRGTCLAFNHLMGCWLWKTAHLDFQNFKQHVIQQGFKQHVVQKEKSLRPSQRVNGNRKVTIFPGSGRANSTSIRANLQVANRLGDQLESFKIYLLYLQRHITPHAHSEASKSTQNKLYMLMTSLETLDEQAQTTLQELKAIQPSTLKKITRLFKSFFNQYYPD